MAQLKSQIIPFTTTASGIAMLTTVPADKFWFIQYAAIDSTGGADFGVQLDGATLAVPFFRSSRPTSTRVTTVSGNLYCPPNSQIFLINASRGLDENAYLNYFEFDNN